MSWLCLRDGASYIDATVGLGGHAQGILRGSGPTGRLLAIDADPRALEHARARLARYAGRVRFAEGTHAGLATMARREGFGTVDGILFDLGVSSMQLDDPSRGFSFGREGPLDMRMGPQCEFSAFDIVNSWQEASLAQIIRDYGEERHARRVARAICQARPLGTTVELASVVSSVVRGPRHIHPATRTFQALRIAVNDELRSLQVVLPQAVSLLKPGGRLVVIAFHSLEDRIVKRYLVRESRDCLCPPRLPQCVCGHVAAIRRLTKKPVRPTESEVRLNRRSRSARLRVAERLGETQMG